MSHYIQLLSDNTMTRLSLYRFVNLGDVGVSTFFLISGFLILHSRQRSDLVPYLIRRVFRIFPVAIVSVVLCYFLVIFVNNHFLGTHYAIDWSKMLLNALLINTLFGVAMIIPVFWSLYVEIKFYLLVGLLGRKINIIGIIILSLVMVTLIYIIGITKQYQSSHFFVMVSDFCYSFVFITYMLIGSCIYIMFKRWINSSQTSFLEFLKETNKKNILLSVLAIVSMFLLFAVAVRVYMKFFYTFPMNHFFKDYAFCVLLFIILIINHKKLDRFKSKTLTLLGDLSYPIYTLHYMFMASIIFLLGRYSLFSKFVILHYIAALIIFIMIAYIVHIFVEKPGIKYGGTLAKKMVANKAN